MRLEFPIRLSPDLIDTTKIKPAEEEFGLAKAKEQSGEPIKSLEDIRRIRDYFLAHHSYRNNLLFIMGINFGLRISDLKQIRLGDIITKNGRFKQEIVLQEKKTSNTKKRKVNRHIYVNRAVREAVSTYVNSTDVPVSLSDYLFRSRSHNGSNKNVPLSTQAVNDILHGVCKELNLNIRFSSHSLRKTFGYHQMRAAGNDPRMLLLLQRIFNHSTPQQTLEYIGLTEDEIRECYEKLNLGLTENDSPLSIESAYSVIA